jgi:hypothetical protein
MRVVFVGRSVVFTAYNKLILYNTSSTTYKGIKYEAKKDLALYYTSYLAG